MTLDDLKMMYTPEKIISHTLNVEGGYVDNVNDLGGRTRYGITEHMASLYKHLWDKYGFTGIMSELPYDMAFEIIRLEFWNKMRLDDVWEVSPVLAAKMLDWGVNAGTRAPVKALQEHLNASNRMAKDYPDMAADGIVGSRTVANLKAYIALRGREGSRWLMTYLFARQTVNYMELCLKREKNETFYNGWLDRVENEQAKAIKLMS